MKNFFIVFVFVFIIFLFGKCFDIKIDDKFNRRIYAFNRGLDKSFLAPATIIYINLVPNIFDKCFNNFFKNMHNTQDLVYYYLSGGFDFLEKGLYKCVLCSFFGFLGFFDLSYVFDDNDFYFNFQTFLLKNNIIDRTYMVLPIIGPGMFYFNIGLFLSHFLNPVFYFSDKIFFYYLSEVLIKKSFIFFDSAFFHKKMIDGYIFLKDVYIQNSYCNIDNDLDFNPPD